MVFMLAGASCAISQNITPSPTPARGRDSETLKISTNLIQIDVAVTDKNGRVIRDLRPDEFEIYENDRKQAITNFSFISEAPRNPTETAKAKDDKIAIPVPPTTLRPENVRRTIALVVDDITLSFESVNYVRQALKKFVNEQMMEGDLVAIIRTAGGIGALQQFTSDKRQLLAAIERIRWNRLSANAATFEPIQGKVDLNTGGFDIASSGPGDRMPDAVDKENRAERNSVFVSGTLGALNYVMRGMRTLPGRKSIMLMSDGFKLYNRDASGSMSTNGIFLGMKKLVEDANKASVVIYTMDARGLQTLSFTAADSPNTIDPVASGGLLSERKNDFNETQDSLIYLADQTGGFAVVNNNDLSGGIRRMLDDQSYYLLGYVLESDAADLQAQRANKLTVKVTRENVKVRYRSAFFGVKDGSAGVPFKVTQYDQIYEALASPFAFNGITVRLNTLFAYNEKDRSFMRSFLYVNARELKFTQGPDGKYNAKLRIMAINFGDNGVPADQQDLTATLGVPPEKFQEILETGYVYGFSFPVKKPGAYQMRVAIRDEGNGKVGSANQFIEAPDLKKTQLALSGIVLENMTLAELGNSPSLAQGDKKDQTVQRDLAMGDTSLRRFSRGTALRYGIEVYKAKPEKTGYSQVKIHIRIYRNGKLLLTGEPRPVDLSDPKRPMFIGAIGLGAEMEPGDYILQIVAEDGEPGGGAKTAVQFVQFEVVE